MAMSHAYSVLQVAEIFDKNGEKIKLIRIRNPWSTEAFEGKAHDDDEDFWQQEVKNQVGHVSQEDGCFWMTLDEFYETMLYITISFYHDDWYHSYIE